MYYKTFGLDSYSIQPIDKNSYNVVICVNRPNSELEENDDQKLITLNSGATYFGALKNGEFHGQGTYTWTNGDKYVGEWKDGDMNGQGILTQSRKGHKHVGEFKDDKSWTVTVYNRNGTIIARIFNGRMIQGEWE